MTLTQRPTTRARYHGEVYGIDLLDHTSVMAGTPKIVVNDYVGKTRQRGRARENQHRDDQPWSDLIVGSPRVLWEGICTEDELDAVERHFIQDVDRRPRMNWLLNEDNPEQVPKPRAVEQRWARDDAANKPRWVPPKQRTTSSDTGPPKLQPCDLGVRTYAANRRCWSPLRVKAWLWSTAWSTSTAVMWADLARLGHPQSWKTQVLCASLTVTVALLYGLHRKPKRRRRR